MGHANCEPFLIYIVIYSDDGFRANDTISAKSGRLSCFSSQPNGNGNDEMKYFERVVRTDVTHFQYNEGNLCELSSFTCMCCVGFSVFEISEKKKQNMKRAL